MTFQRNNLSDQELVALYEALLRPRMIEERMLLMLRQGQLTKWFSGIGQEAISVGAAAALPTESYILPLHRNLGVFTQRGVPLDRLIGQFLGKRSGFTKGRDRSFHFGSRSHKLVGMISHLGPQLAVADGIGLAEKLQGTGRPTLVFSGDGATSEGDFHEALNVAAVWKLPVIFLIENNQYSLSTPTSEQYALSSLAEKGPCYGIPTRKLDGNNVLEVYHAVKLAAEQMKADPQPVLIEAETFRMRGHEEASGTDYVPDELFAEWAEKDPIERYKNYLTDLGLWDEAKDEALREKFSIEAKTAAEKAVAEPALTPDPQEELRDVYAPAPVLPDALPSGPQRPIRFVDAIREGMDQALEQYERLVFMGQDIAEYGGVFKASEGLSEKHGKHRVRNTPLCESAILGMGLGLSVRGFKSIIEMQFADFVTCGFNQLVNNLAKSHYRWGQNADVVVRLPSGGGLGSGPFHSQSPEAWFLRVPGLKILYPSTPADAKGLLLAAIADPNPVLFFEHKYLYRSLTEPVPQEAYTVPIGPARWAKKGSEVTIITYGLCVHWALEICEEKGIDATILDLRTLLPWDKEAVAEAVAASGRVLLLTEDTLTGSITAEIAAWIGENCFEKLDAPVQRLGSLDTPIPFATPLEEQFLPKERLGAALDRLLNY